MENRIAVLEKRLEALEQKHNSLLLEVTASKMVLGALMHSVPKDRDFIAYLATARLGLEAHLLNQGPNGVSLPQMLECFDSALPPDLRQKVLASGDFDPKP
jgi:hypothetical protein